MTRRWNLTFVVLAAMVIAVACGGRGDTHQGPPASSGLRVASFDFAESALLAEMYAQLVESTGVPVIRLGSVGPREIIAPAMELGRIDLVPEYLGTALQYEGATDPNADTGSSLTQLDDLLARRGLTTLAVARAQDTNTIVVTRDTAERDELETISDLAPLASGLRFGGPAECPDRPLCLAGLEKVYGLRFAEFISQRSLVFTAEALRRGEIDVGLMFSTSPELESTDLVELVDDLGMQPAENVVPVVRAEALQRWGPDPAVAIDAMSQELTTADLRRLNRQVSDGDAVEDVVRGWLTERELLE